VDLDFLLKEAELPRCIATATASVIAAWRSMMLRASRAFTLIVVLPPGAPN
jgi:hypothetical protein